MSRWIYYFEEIICNFFIEHSVILSFNLCLFNHKRVERWMRVFGTLIRAILFNNFITFVRYYFNCVTMTIMFCHTEQNLGKHVDRFKSFSKWTNKCECISSHAGFCTILSGATSFLSSSSHATVSWEILISNSFNDTTNIKMHLDLNLSSTAWGGNKNQTKGRNCAKKCFLPFH